MPRAEKTGIYERRQLESMPRAKLQALAKKHGIRANAKTDLIIAQLLATNADEKSIVAPRTPPQAIPTGAVKPEFVPIADTFPKGGPQLVYTPQESASAVKVPAISKRSAYHISTPYPKRRPSSESVSQSGSSPASQSGSQPRSPSEEGPTIPTISPRTYQTQQQEAKAVPMKQTDVDVRVVRRHLTKLVNEQAALKQQIQEVDDILAYSEKEVKGSDKGLYSLRWRRTAIEHTILQEMKCDRHLWDGTSKLSPKAASKWADFVAKSWNGPLVLRAPFPIHTDVDEDEDEDDEEQEEDRHDGKEQ